MNLKKVSGWYRVGFYILLVPLVIKFLYDILGLIIFTYVLTHSSGAF